MTRAMLLSLLSVLLLAADPDSVPIEEGDVQPDVLEGAPIEVDLDKPIDDDVRSRGGDFRDPNFLFTIPSPGPEWLRISPVESMPSLRAAFVHTRGDQVLSLITVGVDANPSPKDASAYAQSTFKTLTSPPLLFKIDTKGKTKIAGKEAFTVSYHSAKGDRGYEQVYLPGKSGTLVVLTFQAPKSTFEAERAAFRKSAGAIRFE